MSNVRRREHKYPQVCDSAVLCWFSIQHAACDRLCQLEAEVASWHGCRASGSSVYKSSARAKARTRTNVAQSMGPQPLRFRITVTTRKVSVALPCGLPLKLGMQPFPALTATPNPSIERTRSGRLLQAIVSFLAFRSPPPRAAHVKR